MPLQYTVRHNTTGLLIALFGWSVLLYPRFSFREGFSHWAWDRRPHALDLRFGIGGILFHRARRTRA